MKKLQMYQPKTTVFGSRSNKVSLMILLWFIHSAVIFAQSNNQKVLVTDLTKIKQITSVIASPTAKKALYWLKTTEPNAENNLEYDYRTHLYLVDLQTNTTKQLTRGSESIGNATFSPTGNSIAFSRVVKGKSQIFIMPLDGGEAWQLTNFKYGASNPSFSPDGSKILFSSTHTLTEILKDSSLNTKKEVPLWSMEKPGFSTNDYLMRDKKIKPNPDGTIDEIRAYLDKDVEDKKAKVFNRLNFQGEATVEPEFFFNHLYLVELKENAKPQALTSGFWSYNQATFSTDGKRIYAVSGKDQNQHPDREQESVILSMNLDGSDKKILVSEENKSFGNITLSPDGKQMAFVMNSPNLLSFAQLVVANADGSSRKLISFDRVPSTMKFSEDNGTLYFTASSNGGIPFYKMDMKTQKIDRITDFDTGIADFDLTADKVVFVKTEVKNPSELYVSDLGMKNPLKISSHNDSWLKDRKLSFPEKRIYKNSKEQDIEFWIMKPTFAEAGKKYPLVLNLHGGPTAMWGPGEFSMWHEFQYLCSQGYGVVYPNQRGSGGYGKDFQFSNYRDWGTGPQEDALGACTAAAKESWVDTSKQVITGGSYAGYLTAWIVGHDHRFKAAFAQRGVYDLTTFMGEGNAWRLVPNYFGLPWEDEKTTKINFDSPYSYVNQIRTPLLIKHGENDLRTGVIQSEMMFRSLKYLGKEVEYVRMPGGTHELSRTGNVRQRIDRMLRIYEFFERFVGKK